MNFIRERQNREEYRLVQVDHDFVAALMGGNTGGIILRESEAGFMVQLIVGQPCFDFCCFFGHHCFVEITVELQDRGFMRGDIPDVNPFIKRFRQIFQREFRRHHKGNDVPLPFGRGRQYRIRHPDFFSGHFLAGDGAVNRRMLPGLVMPQNIIGEDAETGI